MKLCLKSITPGEVLFAQNHTIKCNGIYLKNFGKAVLMKND